jgi:hypothetical protein
VKPSKLRQASSRPDETLKTTGVAQAFANLSRWRAVPGYQSERRIDALLSPFIGLFLSRHFEQRGHGRNRAELVTSEFPLPATLYVDKGQPASKLGNAAADFLVLRKGDDPAWILVELKMDLGSRNKEQVRRYEKLANCTMELVLSELEAAKQGTPFEAGYLELANMVRSKGRLKTKLEVCYLQPRATVPRKSKAGRVQSNEPTWEPNYTFGLGEIAGFLATIDDELAVHLCRFLRGTARSEKARRVKDRPRSRSVTTGR